MMPGDVVQFDLENDPPMPGLIPKPAPQRHGTAERIRFAIPDCIMVGQSFFVPLELAGPGGAWLYQALHKKSRDLEGNPHRTLVYNKFSAAFEEDGYRVWRVKE